MYRDPSQRNFARRLRNEPTAAEKLLWHFLRGGKLGTKFRRQAAIGAESVGFICFARQRVVELDEPQHLNSAARDYFARRRVDGVVLISHDPVGESELDENLREAVEEI